MGSGTVAKVAKELNRNYIGFEISPEYCKMANDRLKNCENESTYFNIHERIVNNHV